ESITSLVREIVSRSNVKRPKQQPSKKLERSLRKARREALGIVFSGLSQFRNLKILRLNFHRKFRENDPKSPTHYLLLEQIFAALASNSAAPLLVSLALNNLIAIPDNIYAQDHFHRLFRSLQELDISVLSDWQGYYDPLLGEFWDESVPHMVRNATAVTALTIHGDQAVGAAPAMSFEDMFLPQLSSLVLHQFAFQDDLDMDVVKFILRHKATLARLELHGCSIEGGAHGYFPRP
ncbi:hypothetical protein B0H14DRAFT_2862146, partial [Mycena olivaceomarginata]